jgi:hypothetical protein
LPESIIKVDPEVLPLGYILSDIPRFYRPDMGWYDDPEYLKLKEPWDENNVIIGYDEKTETGIHITFKIRSPVQNITNNKDKRTIEKGSACLNKSKEFVMLIFKKLGVKLEAKMNVDNLCQELKAHLVAREISERQKGTNIKWFYFYYEKHASNS